AEPFRVLDLDDGRPELVDDGRDRVLEREHRRRRLQSSLTRPRGAARRRAAAERHGRDNHSGDGRTRERAEPPQVPTQHLTLIPAHGGVIGRTPSYNQAAMIYCVIPRELADELYDKMVEYYKDNPNVTVIVDRREGGDRRKRSQERLEDKEKRTVRDRRR